MANTTESATGGIGIGGFLFLIFVTLKLTNYINWSWWWVTSPIWIPILFGLVVMAIPIIWVFIYSFFKFLTKK